MKIPKPPRLDNTKTIKQIKDDARGRWRDLLIEAGIPAELLDGKNHPCPKCGGTDRFNASNSVYDDGRVFCRKCFGNRSEVKPGDGIASIAWILGKGNGDAAQWVRSRLNGSTADSDDPKDVIEQVCRDKRMPVDAFKEFGVKAAKRGSIKVARVDVYDERGNIHSHFDLAPGHKGWFKKGDGNSGLFFPGKLPQPGEHWIVVEGVKDAAALVDLGYNCVGLPTSKMASKYAKLFQGCAITIVPDQDRAGHDGADATASVLHGIASSVKIARLRSLFSESRGPDVRDTLAEYGERSVRESIDRAYAWPIHDKVVCDPNEYVPFPTSTLPDPIRSFVEEGSRSIGCDESFIALPMIAGLGSAIGNSTRLRLKSDWLVPPIIWSAVVGDSGTSKSPAFRLALEPFTLRQTESFEKYRESLNQHESDLMIYERDFSKWKKHTHESNPPDKPVHPICTRNVVGDVTVEALAPILAENPRGLLLARDELSGWLGSFDKYSSGKGSDAAHFLSMFNGESIFVDRKSGTPRTIHVPNAMLSVTGGIQPMVLDRILGIENRENGLLARMLLALPPRRQRRWSDVQLSETTRSNVCKVVDSLFERHPAKFDGESIPNTCELDREANDLWVEFYNSHNARMVESCGYLTAAYSKLEEYAARLALVFHLTRHAWGELEHWRLVDSKSMESAIDLTNWFANEIRRVYGILSESEESKQQRELVELIRRKGGTVTVRELQRSGANYLTSDEAERALQGLVKAGLGNWKELASGPSGGRPTHCFTLHVTYDTTP